MAGAYESVGTEWVRIIEVVSDAKNLSGEGVFGGGEFAKEAHFEVVEAGLQGLGSRDEAYGGWVD